MVVAKYLPCTPLVVLLAFIIYVWVKRREVKSFRRLVLGSLLALAVPSSLGLFGIETNLGKITLIDVGVMFVAMTFGPAIGALSGAGAGLAFLTGSPYLIPVVVVARSLEGLLTGWMSRNGKGFSALILGGVSGGLVATAVMVAFYYWSGGICAALRLTSTVLTEVTTGILLGTALSGSIRKRYSGLEETI